MSNNSLADIGTSIFLLVPLITSFIFVQGNFTILYSSLKKEHKSDSSNHCEIYLFASLENFSILSLFMPFLLRSPNIISSPSHKYFSKFFNAFVRLGVGIFVA